MANNRRIISRISGNLEKKYTKMRLDKNGKVIRSHSLNQNTNIGIDNTPQVSNSFDIPSYQERWRKNEVNIKKYRNNAYQDRQRVKNTYEKLERKNPDFIFTKDKETGVFKVSLKNGQYNKEEEKRLKRKATRLEKKLQYASDDERKSTEKMMKSKNRKKLFESSHHNVQKQMWSQFYKTRMNFAKKRGDLKKVAKLDEKRKDTISRINANRRVFRHESHYDKLSKNIYYKKHSLKDSFFGKIRGVFRNTANSTKAFITNTKAYRATNIAFANFKNKFFNVLSSPIRKLSSTKIGKAVM